jgi:hypothetical protein
LILVISNLANEAANDLALMLPHGTTTVVTASDFHQSFRAAISVGDFSSSEITLGGARITAGEISGIVSTIPGFLPQEFYYIEPADREYVCAEMTAFLIYFLSELACKKLNPPSPRSLCGLGLNRIEWLTAAAGCGVPIWPVHTKNGVSLPVGDTQGVQQVTTTIIGETVLGGDVPEKIGGYLRALAKTFVLPYLSCAFVSPPGGDYLLADLASVPDVSLPEHRAAMVRFLQSP